MRTSSATAADGRLWDENKRLQERYKRFKINELKKVAVESIGADTCISMTRFDEGGFNKVFHLAMNNGSIAIARILNYDDETLFRTIVLEVATVDFVCTTKSQAR